MEALFNIGAYEIQEYQQNRYPMFFLDVIEEARPGEYARGRKSFTYNEWYFPVHFADEPNVPGMIQIELLAQTFIMTFLTIPEHKGKKTAFLGMNNMRMRKKIVPGDTIVVEATLKSFKRGVATGYVEGRVGGEFALSADIKIGLPDMMREFIPKK
ncbi:MAG: beta-hydroxyacyl-ACP dehydratase [Lachnospiraceae bacterium]|nr:beta-hydroxyacyl-ACP dehydratase [Lachnospiraceae bacterium]